MNDIEIKNALENLEVQPSPHCWQAIESQLAAGVGAAAAAGAAKSAGRAAWISSAAAKVTLGVVSALLVAAGVALAVLLPDKSSESSGKVAPLEPESEAIICESVDSQEPVFDVVATEKAEAVVSGISRESSVETETSQSMAVPVASAAPALNSAAAAENSSLADPIAVAAPVPVAQKTAPADVSSQERSDAKSSQSSSKTVVTQVVAQNSEDPVLEQFGFDDESVFEAPISIEIPNVMTPNGDGYNDFFIIKGVEHCEKNRLLVKNRAGTVVLQVNNYQNNWDAAGLSAGTYYYQFYYTLRGIEQVRTGSLTIMR